MHVVIAGAGDVGHSIAEEIIAEGHEVAIIDRDSKAVKAAQALDALVVHGNPVVLGNLEKAGIREADYFFGVTDSNEANIIACTIAKSFRCRTIARINNIEYLNTPISVKFSSIGVDIAISPDLVAAKKIGNILMTPLLVRSDLFEGGEAMILQFKINEGLARHVHTIKDLKLPYGCHPALVLRGSEVIFPGKRTRLSGEDLLIFIALPGSVHELEEVLGKSARIDAKEKMAVMVVGATDFGLYLAKMLESRGVAVAIIDSSEERCAAASQELKKARVIFGDVTDRRTLVEEGILSVDAVVAATGSEEFNMLVGQLAKVYGIERTAVVIHQSRLKSLVETVGIDVAVSPKQLTSTMAMNFIKGFAPTRRVPLHGGEVMAMETKVSSGSDADGTYLRELELPALSNLVLVRRGDDHIIPGQETRFRAGDRLILFVHQDVANEVELIFRG